jgi:hypothetical protein
LPLAFAAGQPIESHGSLGHTNLLPHSRAAFKRTIHLPVKTGSTLVCFL